MDELHETFFNAVNNGIVPQLEYILAQKSLDVNKVDKNGRSALHIAAITENYEICYMIAKHKNTEITPDAKRETVLHILSRRKMLELDKKIIKQLVQSIIKRGTVLKFGACTDPDLLRRRRQSGKQSRQYTPP
jgi:ankyrin repeat protein